MITEEHKRTLGTLMYLVASRSLGFIQDDNGTIDYALNEEFKHYPVEFIEEIARNYATTKKIDVGNIIAFIRNIGCQRSFPARIGTKVKTIPGHVDDSGNVHYLIIDEITKLKKEFQGTTVSLTPVGIVITTASDIK